LAIVLYLTELSRAVGVVLAASGGVLIVTGAISLSARRGIPRWLLWTFASLALLLLIVGVATWIIAAISPKTAV
jgi:hypothetical protein